MKSLMKYIFVSIIIRGIPNKNFIANAQKCGVEMHIQGLFDMAVLISHVHVVELQFKIRNQMTLSCRQGQKVTLKKNVFIKTGIT